MRRRRVEGRTLGPDVPGLITLPFGTTMDCEAYKREAEKTMAVIDALPAAERRAVHEHGVEAIRTRGYGYRGRAR